MELIFHEKQYGSLCAQHCLNNLLQDNNFSVTDLADIARALDDTERNRMAEAGFNTIEYQNFLQQPSSNFDDSGFFSIQVIESALRCYSLDLLTFTSSDAYCQQIRSDPLLAKAFVCNFHQHWFTIRKLGNQWFNLNSILNSPELISDTYLTLFLKQLQTEGYSIFIVRGTLPSCEADEILAIYPAVQTNKSQVFKESDQRSDKFNASDPELQWALQQSLISDEEEDASLQRALQLSSLEIDRSQVPLSYQLTNSTKAAPISTQNNSSTLSSRVDETLSAAEIANPEEVRKRRLAYLDKTNTANITAPGDQN